jgi:hypothetical protein
LRLSVLNSTRRHPRRSKACPSMRSLASTLAPVPQREGTSQVHPISSPRCSGRSARYWCSPTAPCAGVEGNKRGLDSRLRTRQGILEPAMERLAILAGVMGHPAPNPRIPSRLEEAPLVARLQRLQTDGLTFQHAPQVLPHMHHPFAGPKPSPPVPAARSRTW